jgi:hypothetical protein
MSAHNRLQIGRALLEDDFGQTKAFQQRASADVANAWREAQTQPSSQTVTRRNHGFSLKD